jgi:peptide/nickel transport system substrate-binding protein
MNIWQAAAVAAGVVLCASSASAQKSKDTLRFPLNDPVQGVSYYEDPKTETVFETAGVYDTLIAYDEDKNTFEPLLAKSFKRIDDTTLEFEMRDDVTWHDGQKLTADDVIYTINWILDPKTQLRFKNYWDWVDKVEKTGPNTIRIHAKQPTAFDLSMISFYTYIEAQHAHGKTDDKVSYIRHPVGSSMYKVTKVDPAVGITFEKNPAYKWGGTAKPASNIGKMELLFLPDSGTRIAKFLAGELEILPKDTPLDQAEELAKKPGVELTIGQGTYYTYLAIDAKGRSGVKALTDLRVRKAIFMAVDRDELYHLTIGDHEVPRPEAMCWRSQGGCDYSVPLPKYDPAGAKKLLAEAGYPNGFDLVVSTFTNLEVAQKAEAIANQLRKVGIRAAVQKWTLGSYREAQRDGKLQVFAGGWPGGGMPDVTATLAFVYSAPPTRDYHGDPELSKMAQEVDLIVDPAKRKALGRKVFDRSTEMAYFLPTAPGPIIAVHTKDLAVRAGTMHSYGLDPWWLNWK